MPNINQSVIIVFFLWYLFEVPRLILKQARANIYRGLDTFSVPIHLASLFAPWKQDVVSMEGVALFDRFKIYIMNMVSRFFGFFLRLILIIIGTIWAIVIMIAFTIYLALWYLLPALAIILIIYGIKKSL